MAVSTSTSISVTVAQAVSFLTRPLIVSYPAPTIVKLRLILEANLTALYAPTWVPREPLRGSGRRCLTLSPDCLPPRVIYAACLATNVQWFDWISLLGGAEFDFIVDPGCVSIRPHGRSSQMVTVWADELPSPAPTRAHSYDETHIQAALKRQSDARAKTLTQQLLEQDDEEDLFSMIANEVSAPTWRAPALTLFPSPPRSISPLSSSSTHSRSSSRSSNSSGAFSSNSSSSSVSTVSSSSRAADKKGSRREKARQARVFVDTSKTEVTPYDGGKTTVLTGGVMLGGGRKVAKPASASPSYNWRAVRA